MIVGEKTMSNIDEDALREQGGETLRAARAFLRSDERRRYSNQRIDDGFDDIRAAAREGLRILDESGKEFFNTMFFEY